MRILFAGTPGFAARALSALYRAGHDIALVLTQPDRPAGRGMKAMASDVKREALALGLEVYQPASLKDPAAQAPLRVHGAHCMVVAAYGLILPPAVLEMFPAGCLNIHASLLPRWRGAAPIQRAIMAGDAQTGICIMQMEAGLDTGPVLLSQAIPIEPADTGGSLHDRLAELGAHLIVEALAQLGTGSLLPTPQPEQGVTYAKKLGKDDAAIDWQRGAKELHDQIRALNPAPVAFTLWEGAVLRLWQTQPLTPDAHGRSPGTVVSVGTSGIDVACGTGVLRITHLQRAGGKQQSAAEFVRGRPVPVGTKFGT